MDEYHGWRREEDAGGGEGRGWQTESEQVGRGGVQVFRTGGPNSKRIVALQFCTPDGTKDGAGNVPRMCALSLSRFERGMCFSLQRTSVGKRWTKQTERGNCPGLAKLLSGLNSLFIYYGLRRLLLFVLLPRREREIAYHTTGPKGPLSHLQRAQWPNRIFLLRTRHDDMRER